MPRLKGITVNYHNPSPIEISIFSLSSGCNNTYQYPFFRSNIENLFTPISVSKVSSIRRSRKQSSVMSFNLWYSTQTWRPPSFWTSTTGDNQVLSDFWITPLPFVSPTLQFTSAFLSKVSQCGSWQMGHGLLVSIQWYTLFVCLFATLAAKTSWRMQQTQWKNPKREYYGSGSWFVLPTRYNLSDYFRKNGMCGACGIFGVEEKCVHGFSGKTLTEQTTWHTQAWMGR